MPATPKADEAEVAEVADTWVDEDDDATRVRGVGEPVGLLPARRRGVADENAEPESALPPLQPAPPPPIPPGTSLVVVDDDELDLHDLGTSVQCAPPVLRWANEGLIRSSRPSATAGEHGAVAQLVARLVRIE